MAMTPAQTPTRLIVAATIAFIARILDVATANSIYTVTRTQGAEASRARPERGDGASILRGPLPLPSVSALRTPWQAPQPRCEVTRAKDHCTVHYENQLAGGAV